MWTISSEGVTPPSSLLRAHVPLPLGSPLLRHLASFEESLQVVHRPCCPRELPDVISENLSLDAGSRTPAVPPCALTCSFHGAIGLPQAEIGSASRVCPANTTSRRSLFRGCRYSLMFRPPSLLTPQIVPTAAILPQGSRGFYVRAYRALSHAPDMLTVRIQAIDGTGTFTLSDSQPCRLLTPPQGPSLESGLFCPEPSSLTRPHPPPSRAHHHFIAWRLIGDAFAVRERLGDPRGVPSFRCPFFPGMPSSMTPGSSTSLVQNFGVDVAFAEIRAARHSRSPAIRFPRGTYVGASWFTHLLRPVRLLAPLVRI
jgi:hypothetical protein